MSFVIKLFIENECAHARYGNTLRLYLPDWPETNKRQGQKQNKQETGIQAGKDK